MPAPGSTPIIIYNSSTASQVPLAANLSQGELAINVTDKKLYTKDSGGNVVLIASNGGDVTGPATATDNAIARFDATTGKLIQNSVVTIADTTGNMAGVGTLSAGAITSSALTSGRVTFASTGGLLADSATFTYNGTNLGLGIAVPTTTVGNTLHINDATSQGAEIHLTDSATSGSAAGDGGILLFAGNELYLWNQENSFMSFGTNNTERMRITASGNLGLGVTPSAWGGSFKALQVGVGTGLYNNSNANGTFLGSNYYYNGTNNIYIATSTATAYAQDSGAHKWYTAPSGTAGNAITFTQAMTLDASGNLLVGTTNISASAGDGIKLLTGASSNNICIVQSGATNATDAYHLYSSGAGAFRFYVGLGGTVYATSTTISAISDIRYKENVRDLDVGLDAVLALKPRLYDWKEGKGADIKNARGFIAQEFEEVFPDLIDEWKDPAPEGEEAYKSVRQDLIPVLVKAIQEQQAMIDELKAKVAALEAA